MAQLSLHLLGTFQAELDNRPLEDFRSNKVRALLAYLAMEREQNHLRARLAGLLWPDWPEATARAYLRQAVANLRALLGDSVSREPFLLVTPQTIQLDPNADIWADAAVLAEAGRLPSSPSGHDVTRLEDAIVLYRGSFLEGFSLEGCPAFEEWQLLTREQIRRRVERMCSLLAQWYEARHDLSSAVHYARRGVELDPLWEEGQGRLIRLLAKQGERAAALSHYDHFVSLLAEELGIDPAPNTVALAAQIRDKAPSLGDVAPPLDTESIVTSGWEVAEPPFLVLRSVDIPTQPFVDRVEALQELDEHLEAAVSGQGHMAFVAGEAGQGKTLLVRQFSRRALERYPTLVVAGGSSGGSSDLGDPFQPFRELLAQLTGDLEAQWRSGAIARDHVRRLWRLLPQLVDALLVHGPDLLDRLVSATALARRLEAAPSGAQWQARLQDVMDSTPSLVATLGSQIALFDQCTKFLQAVSRDHPLLLWLDDLQWADASSLALLFHLGQRLEGYPILVVGAYRPEEVGALGEKNALERIIGEMRNRHGRVMVDLDRAPGRHFVRAYLASMRHRLDGTFEETLCRLSGGHALFTVELVSDMKERGFLVRDANQYWVEGPALDWEVMPARVEAVIGQRIERLPDELRQVLDVAAEEGEHFTAEVVAAVLQRDAAETIRCLSSELDRRHRLVAATGVEMMGDRRLSRYRFRHALFQRYVTRMLDPVQGAQLHEAIGRSLEEVHMGQAEPPAELAGRLAWHYEQAALAARAATYYGQAGTRALRLAAYDEAIALYIRGANLVAETEHTSDRDALELDLLIGLGTAQAALHGDAAPDVEDTFKRAHRLSRYGQDEIKHAKVLWHLWELRYQRGEFRTALSLAQACMEAAERVDDEIVKLAAYSALGCTHYRIGEFAEAHKHLSSGLLIVRTAAPSHGNHFYSCDPSVHCLVNASLVTWYLGYPERSKSLLREGLNRAEDLNHPYSLAFAHGFGAALGQRSRDVDMTIHYAVKTNKLCKQWGISLHAGASSLYHGWALVVQGNHTAGHREAEQGLAAVQGTGMEHVRYVAVLADIDHRCGRPQQGLARVQELLDWVARSEEREWEAELYRLRGELRLQLAGGIEDQLVVEAEQDFQIAADVAHRQQAKTLELRAMASLCRLWHAQGKSEAAIGRLSDLYGWFTEGFDTPDLQEARALLSELHAVPS